MFFLTISRRRIDSWVSRVEDFLGNGDTPCCCCCCVCGVDPSIDWMGWCWWWWFAPCCCCCWAAAAAAACSVIAVSPYCSCCWTAANSNPLKLFGNGGRPGIDILILQGGHKEQEEKALALGIPPFVPWCDTATGDIIPVTRQRPNYAPNKRRQRFNDYYWYGAASGETGLPNNRDWATHRDGAVQ